MSIDKIKWDMFLEDLEFWEKGYNILTGKLLAEHGLMAVLALKNHIETGCSHFNSTYGEQEREYFQEALENLTEGYNPDKEIEELKNTLICLDINPDSYLYLEYGKSICGCYIGMDEEPVITKLRNKETGEYENITGLIVVKIGYPDPSNMIRVTFQDIKAVSAFT